MSTDRPRFLVTLEALPADTPAPVRLKRLLKFALRGLRLRAVDAREVAGGTPADTPGVARDAADGAGRADGPPAAGGTPQGPAGGPRP